MSGTAREVEIRGRQHGDADTDVTFLLARLTGARKAWSEASAERDAARAELAGVSAERDAAVEVSAISSAYFRAVKITEEAEGRDIDSLLRECQGKQTLAEKVDALEHALAVSRGETRAAHAAGRAEGLRDGAEVCDVRARNFATAGWQISATALTGVAAAIRALAGKAGE